MDQATWVMAALLLSAVLGLILRYRMGWELVP